MLPLTSEEGFLPKNAPTVVLTRARIFDKMLKVAARLHAWETTHMKVKGTFQLISTLEPFTSNGCAS